MTGIQSELSKEFCLMARAGKTLIKAVVNAFRHRLREVAGFKYVPEPMPMRNSKGAVVYYLFFASPNRTGGKIVTDIFDKYRNRGMS